MTSTAKRLLIAFCILRCCNCQVVLLPDGQQPTVSVPGRTQMVCNQYGMLCEGEGRARVVPLQGLTIEAATTIASGASLETLVITSPPESFAQARVFSARNGSNSSTPSAPTCTVPGDAAISAGTVYEPVNLGDGVGSFEAVIARPGGDGRSDIEKETRLVEPTLTQLNAPGEPIALDFSKSINGSEGLAKIFLSGVALVQDDDRTDLPSFDEANLVIMAKARGGSTAWKVLPVRFSSPFRDGASRPRGDSNGLLPNSLRPNWLVTTFEVSRCALNFCSTEEGIPAPICVSRMLWDGEDFGHLLTASTTKENGLRWDGVLSWILTLFQLSSEQT